MLTHRRTLPWILLVLLCLFGLTSPPGSDALVSMSPSTIPKGCSTDVAVTLSSLTEFDPQGPTNNAWAYVYFTSGGGVAQVGTNFTGTPLNNPQSWSLTIPANATGNHGWIGPFTTLNTSESNPGVNPFSSGGIMFSIGGSCTPTSSDGLALTDISPKILFRGYSPFETLTMPGFPNSCNQSVNLELVNGQGGVIHSFPQAYPCSDPLYLYLDIPADLPLGWAFLRNAPDTSGTPAVPVLIMEGPANVITGVTPTSAHVGDASTTLSFSGSGFSDGLVLYLPELDPLPVTRLGATSGQAVLPASLLAQEGSFIVQIDDVNYYPQTSWQNNAFPFTVWQPGGDMSLGVTAINPTSLVAGICNPVQARVTKAYAEWPSNPFLAIRYATASGYQTTTVPLTPDMFVQNGDAITVSASVCLPLIQGPLESSTTQAHIAPGGMVNGQPSAWMYPGFDFTIKLANYEGLQFDGMWPPMLPRGYAATVWLWNSISSAGNHLLTADVHYTVAGEPQVMNVNVPCTFSDGCATTITLPATADVGDGPLQYIANHFYSGDPATQPTVHFAVSDGVPIGITGVVPAVVPVGSGDTLITVSGFGLSSYSAGVSFYFPGDEWDVEGWYDPGYFAVDPNWPTVVDDTTYILTLPARLLVAPVTYNFTYGTMIPSITPTFTVTVGSGQAAWGPNHPTKVTRDASIQVLVETGITLSGEVPAQVLFANASGAFLSGYDSSGACQAGEEDAPPVCRIDVQSIPATAAWGCIRRMANGEQIDSVDPAQPPLWIADETSCPRFTIVDYALPVFDSMTPTLVATGSGGFVLTLNGEWNDAVKLWNYIDIDGFDWYSYQTDFVSLTPTQMKINIPASMVGEVGTVHRVKLWTLYNQTDTPSRTYEVVAQASAAISAGTQEQNSTSVLVPVTWSGTYSNPSVNCGTSIPQTHVGDSVHCTYDAPGTYQITGSYDTDQPTDPVSVTIVSLALQSGSLSLNIGGNPVSAFTAYSLPVRVNLAASYSRPAGVGIPDAIDLDVSSFTITPQIEGSTATTTAVSGNNTDYSGSVNLAPGTYTIALAGTTKAGSAISTSADLTITSGTVSLTANDLAQNGAAVSLPVSFPTVDGVSPQTIDCGTTPSQVIAGSAGTCAYTRAGNYTLTGRFMDSLGTVGIHTSPLDVNVPAVPASATALRAAVANGVPPSHNLSGSVPVATYGTPTQYPVPVALAFTLDPPAAGQVGILDSLDPATAQLSVKPVATAADLTASMTGQPTLTLSQVDDTHFTATGGLSTFVTSQATPSTWRQRFLLTGRTITGQPLRAELYLDGPKGNGSTVAYTVTRIDPIYPYAPASYLYKVSGLATAITGEPLSHTWTVSDNTASTIQGNGNYTAVFITVGQKAAGAQISGPLSGATGYTDPNPPVIVNQPTGAIEVKITPPASNRNRPPASYTFRPNYPPLNPGEKLQGLPTWVADSNQTTSYTGTNYTYAFPTPGAHSVSVTQPTTQRSLMGTASVTVNTNQAPTGTVDCTASYKVNATSYVVSCKTVNAKDPDGILKAMTWALPDLAVNRAGSTFWSYGLSGAAQLVTVTLTLTDDSGASTVLTTTVDFRTMH